MFLLVSGRHVGAHLGGHQHGVSIQISINLGKTFLRVSSIRKIAVTWILARVFAYLPSFYSQILDLIHWTVLIFYFDLFWMAWHWKPAISEAFKVTGSNLTCQYWLLVFSVTPFKIDQNQNSKPFNRLSLESGNRKKVDMQRLSPRFSSQQFFLRKIWGETFSPNL